MHKPKHKPKPKERRGGEGRGEERRGEGRAAFKSVFLYADVPLSSTEIQLSTVSAPPSSAKLAVALWEKHSMAVTGLE